MNIRPSQADFKEDYSQYLSIATDMLHGKETTEPIVKMLSGSDPVGKVAKAAVILMQRIDGICRQQGIEIQDAVRAVAAHQIVDMIVELGEAANILKLDKDHVELALSLTVQNYINAEIQAGRMNRQKVAVGMQADMRQMPPKQRKEVQQTLARIQQTARKYNGGQQSQPEPAPQPAPAPTGMIAGGVA